MHSLWYFYTVRAPRALQPFLRERALLLQTQAVWAVLAPQQLADWGNADWVLLLSQLTYLLWMPFSKGILSKRTSVLHYFSVGPQWFLSKFICTFELLKKGRGWNCHLVLASCSRFGALPNTPACSDWTTALPLVRAGDRCTIMTG